MKKGQYTEAILPPSNSKFPAESAPQPYSRVYHSPL